MTVFSTGKRTYTISTVSHVNRDTLSDPNTDTTVHNNRSQRSELPYILQKWHSQASWWMPLILPLRMTVEFHFNLGCIIRPCGQGRGEKGGSSAEQVFEGDEVNYSFRVTRNQLFERKKKMSKWLDENQIIFSMPVSYFASQNQACGTQHCIAKTMGMS